MPNCLIKHWIQDRAVSVLHAVITPYRWRMILYHCERCPSASSTDNTAGLCANKIQLRTTVPICIFPGCEQGIYPAACWHQHAGKGVLGSCWPTVWPGLTGTARAHSDLIKLDSLSWGTFTSRYIQFFQINPACKGGFVLKVLPLILLPIRRSTGKQKGKRCLSPLSILLLPFCSLHTFAGKLFPPQCISQQTRDPVEMHYSSAGISTMHWAPDPAPHGRPCQAAMPPGAHGQSRAFHTKIDQFLLYLFPLALSTTA